MEIFESAKARDEGIKKATDHAEANHAGWNDRAFDLLIKFLSLHDGPFMTEDVRSYAAMKEDFPFPPSARAWGGVIVRAVNAGLIHRVRYEKVRNKNAHRTPATLWEAVKKSA